MQRERTKIQQLILFSKNVIVMSYLFSRLIIKDTSQMHNSLITYDIFDHIKKKMHITENLDSCHDCLAEIIYILISLFY